FSEVANPLINLINNSMARGTKGAELDHRLLVVSDLLVAKRRSDSFNKTNLDQILTDRQIEKLVIVGLDAEKCVLSSIEAALNRGYKVTVIADGVIAGEEPVKIHMLDTYREMGVEVL
ncbi:MAG: isochorismatase family cysteine hydrolase, partial [Bacteroides sp.]|nr:isochorismatase family cysteine hydrolase [Bacteroides sp.]